MRILKLLFLVEIFFGLCNFIKKINSHKIQSINSHMKFRSINKVINRISFSMDMNIPKGQYSSFPFLEKCVEPSEVRKMLHEKVNENYKYITYPHAKRVLHEHANMIDIYGDNVEAMNVEHVFPQHAFKNDDRKKEMKSDVHNLFLCNSKLNNYRHHSLCVYL